MRMWPSIANLSLSEKVLRGPVLLALGCAVAIYFSASAATPEQLAAAKAEILQIQLSFLQEVQISTNLPRDELDKFMPGGALYGREITEFHRLNSSQMDALRQADSRKKSAISAVRERYGIPPETARAAGSRF